MVRETMQDSLAVLLQNDAKLQSLEQASEALTEQAKARICLYCPILYVGLGHCGKIYVYVGWVHTHIIHPHPTVTPLTTINPTSTTGVPGQDHAAPAGDEVRGVALAHHGGAAGVRGAGGGGDAHRAGRAEEGAARGPGRRGQQDVVRWWWTMVEEWWEEEEGGQEMPTAMACWLTRVRVCVG